MGFFMLKIGYLILENGEMLEGLSFGADTQASGEVVFNTGMTGYTESFTDPSYYGQILTTTYPLIGNYGVPEKQVINKVCQNWESDKIHIRGLIVSSYIDNISHWQSKQTLSSWLKKEKIPALSVIDTRTLTQTLRNHGVMKGKITFQPPRSISGVTFYDINKDNLVAKVSCKKLETYGSGKIKILLIDCGLKYNQIRILLDNDVTVIRVPWNHNPFDHKNTIKFDGILISNGPGDPRMVKETVDIVKEALDRKIPTLGICLGNQILALAAGAKIYKLKYGHRGQNQPVIDNITHKCYITSQNHGFAVDADNLPKSWQPWFTNLNDNTNEGIRHPKLPFYSSQFHPEANPGPTDTEWIIKFFISEIKKLLIR